MRRAYTLTEMIIAVAIIAALFALAWPALARPASRSQLVYAAKQLRAELAQVRLEAIRTGKPWQFCYEQGGRRYYFGPLESTGFNSSTNDFASHQSIEPTEAENFVYRSSPLADDGVTSAREGLDVKFVNELPTGMFFGKAEQPVGLRRGPRPVEVTSGTFDYAVDEEGKTTTPPVETTVPIESSGQAYTSTSPVGADFAPGMWHRIVFLPNGRTFTNQTIAIHSAEGNIVFLLIRAVTGTAIVGHPVAIGPRRAGLPRGVNEPIQPRGVQP